MQPFGTPWPGHRDWQRTALRPSRWRATHVPRARGAKARDDVGGVHLETCGFNHVLTMKKWGFTMKHGGFIVDIADL